MLKLFPRVTLADKKTKFTLGGDELKNGRLVNVAVQSMENTICPIRINILSTKIKDTRAKAWKLRAEKSRFTSRLAANSGTEFTLTRERGKSFSRFFH